MVAFLFRWVHDVPMTITKTALGEKYAVLKIHLDERSLRLCVAADARLIGRGGIGFVSQATGVSRTTISAGLKDLNDEVPLNRTRRSGAGRKPLAETNPDIMTALEQLVDPATRGRFLSVPSGTFLMLLAIACSQIERPMRDRSTPTGTLSSNTFPIRFQRF